ncbi:MAG: amine dehydrogenase large subunit, partial [Pseudomonadales bacterium]|nr:amine dehydrogenase large subunit [Pseudomonadales bacterium]
MYFFKHFRKFAVLSLLFGVSAVWAELPAEPIPNLIKLKTPYPAGYALVHDFAFSGLIDSKFALVDTQNQTYKGMISAGQFATINFSTKRQKFYVGETIHTRGVRGKRQDIITIYDFENLDVVNEIDIPAKRMNVVINESSVVMTADEQFLLVFNMNPGTSVTVINLDSETVVGEIPMPGCTLMYPDTQRGFFSLCGNGGLVHLMLDEQGGEKSRWSSEVFNDIDADPLSEKAAYINGVWYFVSYKGEVQPIDVTAQRPAVAERWWLASQMDRAANWRPAGWHGKAGNATDGTTKLWVAMTPDGYDGSHKDPATEVWLMDVERRSMLKRISLEVPALSIDVNRANDLLVVNIEGNLDVYNGLTGEYRHNIRALGDTPYMVHAVE